MRSRDCRRHRLHALPIVVAASWAALARPDSATGVVARTLSVTVVGALVLSPLLGGKRERVRALVAWIGRIGNDRMRRRSAE